MDEEKKVLVLYVYHKINPRVIHFFENAIFYHPNIDFLVISNNGISPRSRIPDYALEYTRENIGYDFGGWSDALLHQNRYLQYTHFIFVNSSVRGPFLPEGYVGTWVDKYLLGLSPKRSASNNACKLFGSTMNCGHVQSYVFAMNLETLEYLLAKEIFTNKKYTKTLTETIREKEILMSKHIIDHGGGWSVDALSRTKFGYEKTDIMYTYYRNRLWKDTEVVFYKDNRIYDVPA